MVAGHGSLWTVVLFFDIVLAAMEAGDRRLLCTVVRELVVVNHEAQVLVPVREVGTVEMHRPVPRPRPFPQQVRRAASLASRRLEQVSPLDKLDAAKSAIHL